MSELKDFYFRSSSGRNTIRARICTPESPPKAVIQIAHGIAEHIERYDEFMLFLASNGYIAVGNDHLGHGKSAASSEEIGIFARDNGWDYVVKDMKLLYDTVSSQYKELPYILFGHSMGSFLTRTFLIEYPDILDAAIISGTGNQSKSLIGAGYILSEVLVLLKGAYSDGKTLDDIAFGAYCKRIDNPRTSFDWLSRDNTVVDAYIADPLCGFVAKSSLYRDMMFGIRYIIKPKNVSKMRKNLPILFFSGTEDPVGDYGSGVKKAYKLFCDSGMQDVYMKLYPGGRHEMLNESNRAEVFSDILSWIKAKIQ